RAVRSAMAPGRDQHRPSARSQEQKGTPSVHPMQGDEIRALRRMQREQEASCSPVSAHPPPPSKGVFMSRKGFQPGHTGRPRGTRNKLAGRVFEDIFAHWCEPVVAGSNVCKGQEALQSLYLKSPAEYTRLVASVLPKEFIFENAVAVLEYDQIDELILNLPQRALEPPSR